VDLAAVKAASRPELAAYAVAVGRNAQGLLHDAELLAEAGSTARAYSLAALAVEACGKAVELAALAVMPGKLRAQAPVGRMLEWHQLKQVGGLLLAEVGWSGGVAWLARMPAEELARVLTALDEPADEADRLKRRGLYVDMDRDRRIREPSEITESEVDIQLGRARQALAAASPLLAPEAQVRMANPPAEMAEFAQELVKAISASGYSRTPKAAADVLLRVIGELRKDTPTGPPPMHSACESHERPED